MINRLGGVPVESFVKFYSLNDCLVSESSYLTVNRRLEEELHLAENCRYIGMKM